MLRCAIVVLALGAAGAAQAQSDRVYVEKQRERSVREILGHDPYVATPNPPISRPSYVNPNRDMDEIRDRLDRLEWENTRRRWF